MEAPAKRGQTYNSKWGNQLARNSNGISVTQFNSTLTRYHSALVKKEPELKMRVDEQQPELDDVRR